MAGTDRAAIKVGSGYVEITPKVTREDLAEFRRILKAALASAGAEAGKSFSDEAAKGMADLPKTAATAAKKARVAVEDEAKDTAETLNRIERDLTRQFGREAAKRFHEELELARKRKLLTEETSSETRSALRATMRAETQAGEHASRTQQIAERNRIKAIEERRRVAIQAERDQAAAATAAAAQAAAAERARQRDLEDSARMDREIHQERQRTAEDSARMDRELHQERERQNRAWLRLQADSDREIAQAERENQRQALAQHRETQRQIRQQTEDTARALRTARQNDLRDQLQSIGQTRTALRDQIRNHQRDLAALESRSSLSLGNIQKQWRQHSTAIERVGTNATEAGNLVMTKLVAPLGLVAGALTAIGVQSADSLMLGQMGLMKGGGVTALDSYEALTRIRQYGADTPYSVEDMQMYMTKYIRGIVSHDDDYKSKDPKKRAEAGKRSANKAGNIVQMIGDTAAAAGNLDPAMINRAMYAMDMILDLDRLPTKNLKQFVAGTGLPVQEIALGLGFEDKKGSSAADQMLKKMANAKETGGVQGQELVDFLLENWESSGVKGYAKQIGASTITGRMQNMWEAGKLSLGDMFASMDPETGEVQYTGLGEAIMGKKVSYTDKHGQEQTRYEGGLLNDAKDLAKDAAPHAQDVLTEFFDVIGTFTSWVKDLVGWLDEHPAIKDAVLQFAKIAALAVPFLIAFGLLTKLTGKLGKMAGSGLSLARPVAAGARGAVNTGRQALAGREEGESRGDAYRRRRTELRDGDSRSLGRRALDQVTGRNSNTDQITRQIHELQRQLEQADRRSDELRQSLREVDQTSVRQIVNSLSGGGLGGQSVSAAAGEAQNAVRQIVTQGTTPLNNASLSGVRAEFRETDQRVQGLKEAVQGAQHEVTQLNGKRLVTLRVQVDTTEGTVQDLKGSINDTGSAVTALNRKKTDQLQGEVSSLKGAVDQARVAVDNASRRVTALDGKTLDKVRGQFRGGRSSLYGAAEDVYGIIGTAKSPGSISNRITNLNDRSLKSITDKTDKFGKSLKNARDEADKLNGKLNDISKQTGPGSGGGGNGSSKPKKKARGGVMGPGVLPGYQPWVDSIPAILSPGEAVLRPEVTAALGADTINTWNGMAVKGQLSRKFARGGIVERLGLNEITDLMALQNIAPQGQVAMQTMRYDATSDAIGGAAKAGMLNVGDRAGQFAGSGVATKFQGMYDWMTGDVFDLLKKAPTVLGQAAGILAGSLSPIMADHFWDDVWRGEGNVVERGNKYLGNVFSVDTLTSALGNLGSGLWDSLTSLVGGAWDLASDPVGSVNDVLDLLWEVSSGSYQNMMGMVGTVRDISNSPMGYASRVLTNVYATAKESLPNTKGLFDFSDGDKLSASKPDMDQAIGGGDIDPGGDPVKRWTPLVKQVLAMLGLSQSYTDLILHRIRVESGGNPKAINNWDINAKNGVPSQGLMQTIPPTFAAYAGPFRSRGITDPLASIYAGLNYAVSRYGSRWPQALSGTQGYWMGTGSASPGLRLVGEHGPELVNFQGGERVYDDRQTRDLLSGQSKYEIHIHEAKAEDTTSAVLRAMQYAEAMHGW
ncbi:transglycosylase SLT domain-containing protein [Streptomyces uncialis]|uniref:transglycosylase SLT domain-containing protein n=1 Tax=Streptomyces uncialis TaxID=1048205 RepID=UPI000ABEB02E|nr:transglycosylase SLT domain-containing protein [Streptomyces uncialis]